ncbi:hypothetical protein BBJ28_00004854 [Nothophytophthora sp. Chile5]|nr:hypothetical protein BBJ28_00004854 [Nothophytophthora sp. Chile5]
MTTTLRSPLPRSASAPLRPSSRYRVSSVLESALVVHGRADAVVRSTRKPTKKRFLRDEEGGNNAANELERAASAPAGHQQGDGDDEDAFVRLRLRKTRRSVSKKKKNPEKEANTVTSPAVTRSAAKVKHRHAGVLEISGRTPMTRSMTKKWKPSRSSLEQIEDAEEEVDDVQIQKRLFASPERKTKQSKAHKQVAGKHKHEKKRKLQEEEGRGVHAREKKRKKNLIASKGTRTPPRKATKTEDGRVKRKALVLHHWRVEWPPTLVQEGDSETDRRLQLVLIGQVDGASARFVVEKREGPTRFTSSEGEYVALPGGLDRDAARSAGMPRAAMELLKEGVPSFFKTSLLPFAQQRNGPIKPSKPEPKLMQKKRYEAQYCMGGECSTTDDCTDVERLYGDRVPKEVKRVVAKPEPGGGSLKQNKKVVRVTSESESEPEAEAEPSKPKKVRASST